MATLSISGLLKDFKGTTVLKGVDLEVDSGEFISLLGPSGCGKTTLLRCIAGLESVSGGRIVIAGEDVTALPPERRKLGMMFQSYALFPHMSVLENVRFGHRMAGTMSRSEQRRIAHEALETVRMDHLAERMPAQLSGGQQQRVALARAIAIRPRVLLLDEPLSNLDARLREEMQIELIELHRELGLTTVFVTHDQQEAMSLSDRIVLMNGGVIEQEGSPEQIYAAPSSTFAADFIGAANLLPARLTDGQAELMTGNVAVVGEGTAATDGGAPEAGEPSGVVIALDGVAAEARGPGTLALRQEDLVLGREVTARTPLSVEVVTRVYRGADVTYVVELAGHRLKVVASRQEAPFSPGSAALGWREGTPLWLPEVRATTG